MFRDLVQNPLVQRVSVMDHSPGQRQFVLESNYREYYMDKSHLTTTRMDEFITLRHDHRRVPDHRRGRARGMKVLMGAPNIVRGESHSGNVTAADLTAEGLPMVRQVWRQAKRVF